VNVICCPKYPQLLCILYTIIVGIFNDDDDFISINNMIYVVKKGVKNDAHDTKNDKSLTHMA